MSEREKEIFEILKKNPTLQQNEIADILKISRSAVATHIRSLNKKGFIIGRKYILNPSFNKTIVVIGGTNIDLKGISNEKLKEYDSNPGRIVITPGGVGRNITENLAKIAENIKFMSVVGDDNHGKDIIEKLKLLNVDTMDMIKLSNTRTSTYMAILDKNGEMNVAISEMDNIDALNTVYLQNNFIKIKNTDLIVIDTNLSKTSINYLLNNCNKKIIVDLVSSTKALKVENLLKNIFALKANKLEAEVLSKTKINSPKDLETVGKYFIKKGVKQIFITLGKDGVFYMNSKSNGILNLPEIEIKDVTGAGDAFTAGIAYGIAKEYDIQKIAKYAITMSGITIKSIGTVSSKLSPELIKNEYNKFWKEELND